MHKIEKGLDLPIPGKPIQVVRGTSPCSRVAVMADDFPGMKARMHVQEGDVVKRGQVLFEDRKMPGVRHTAPGAGRVIGIHRGERRALQSVVIDLSDGERAGEPGPDEFVHFENRPGAAPEGLTGEQVRALLVESGLWTAIRERPFSKVPSPDGRADAFFITATDTHPHAPLPEVVLEKQMEDFVLGTKLLAKLVDGPTYLCVAEHSEIGDRAPEGVRVERFAGPHPSGTVGLHIHLLRPVNRERRVWHIGYQDVASVGRLFATGRLDVSRIIAISGPDVEDPRLERTRVGARVSEIVGADIARIVESSLKATGRKKEIRAISGSVLSGKRTFGEAFDYMGRYDRQISLLEEDHENVFMGWLSPGPDLFSVTRIYLSSIFKPKRYRFTTSTNGSPRAMVPIGVYEKVMPMDIMATYLLRSLVVGDTERAEQLGVLELDEEDVSLCTFVCPGKTEYGPILRKNLEMIEKEG
ncbi:MAG TPA: Na(+)-translocating NADH-quinone reductase subunit A [Deltaproteobacteria bacterium]|nr:Na(+)-translocating NADH-quinone reductase subunit A [Deltaproteobacteria bacterium]